MTLVGFARVVLVSVVGVVTAMTTTLVPAAGSPAAPSAGGCKPSIEVLPTLEGLGSPSQNSVRGLSLRDGIAVGESDGVPAYWQDGQVHAVPMPGDYAYGKVLGVNRFGLMVGYVGTLDFTTPTRAFRYWAGNDSIEFYPRATAAYDVNDAGLAVGTDETFRHEKVYEFGPRTTLRRVLKLPTGYEPAPPEGASGPYVPTRLAITNGGVILASLQFGEFQIESFTWDSKSNNPTPVGPAPKYVRTDENGFKVYRTAVAVDIDNRNHMVGYRVDVPGGTPFENLSWSSRTATPSVVPYQADEGGATGLPQFTALSDRTGLAAGLAGSTATAWTGRGSATDLPRIPGQSSGALTAQDDGRVGGWVSDNQPGDPFTRHLPALWTCVGR